MGIRRYVHLATGNYNDSTAKLYTDCGIFTCDERFGEDATAVFNMLSGYSEPKRWNKLIVAPIWMKDRFLKLIEREADNARKGQPAHAVFNMLSGYSEPKRWNKLIVAPIWMKDRFLKLIEREADNARKGQPAHIMGKMNSLCDPVIMSALYYASSCGVKIELIVRGICCLKTGIPGVSEHIQVRSIVGDFLEHSRIFYFYNGGREEVYMGSADWMPRNLDRRVEIVFPLEDEEIKKKAIHVLELELKDNVKAHLLQPDGSYVKPDKRGKALFNSQMEFCKEAQEAAHAKKKGNTGSTRVFIPAEHVEEIE